MAAKRKKEAVSNQSAAEFFSEHQQIAGFDNPGKSLFTTIREFVENSLDAAESMHTLPEIELFVEEFSESHHNELHGIRTAAAATGKGAEEDEATEEAPKKGKKVEAKDKEQTYYLVKCCDNGCGIHEDNIGDMLGRVLSGSKHGIRQTRGKFGLGAKMALIWSKKSSGLPIHIRTAHSTSATHPPTHISELTLDIDIYRNEPRILSKKRLPNPTHWRGTEISVTIAGNWGAYRARVLQYFQQLAVITPYARLLIDFQCHRDGKKSFRADFERRSEQMPPIAQEVDPHPKSLNNITLSNLLQSRTHPTVESFLVHALAGVTQAVARRIADSLKITGKSPTSLTSSQVAALIQTLRDEKQIRPPSGQCLSPAGEYNMRLGVMKELKPRMVATFSDKAGVHEGHPFLVEAAVSLGGAQVREGINVYRFANRIPLLFEAGADVVTQVATKRINWTAYHIDPRRDNVGVYVSIVSTKIPFKGTSKEYVGEDVSELLSSVRRALMGCCAQLRVNLAKNLALREEQARRKNLVKYIPNITSALYTVMLKMGAKAAAAVGGGAGGAGASNAGSAGSAGASTASSASSAGKPARASARTLELLLQLSREQLTQETLAERLRRAVDKFEREAMLSTVNTEAVQRSPLFLQARRVEPRMEPKGGAGGAKGGPARALSQGVVDLTDVTDVTDADADSALGKRKAEEVGEVEVLDARGLRGPGWRAARLRPVTGSPGTGGDLEFFLSV